MPDLNDPEHQREQKLNKALEALHFAFRAITAKPDAMLAEYGLSRVHHRVLYFVGRNPGLSINELLAILGVRKQSLNVPLRKLIELGLIQSQADTTDRRVKRLTLTRKGLGLENQLTGDERQRFSRVFNCVGPEGEAAWLKVMHLLAEDEFNEG
ncbi:MAG: MarR family transcriptional regulator [Pseudanabaenales cyanobacterium]|nr:MarR family transcriptional regulator [Pseudanabaenales cyanobacterium]